MPVRRTLLPVVDPAAIEAEQLEVQRTFESTNGLGSCRDTVLPTSALPGPDGLVRLSSYGLIVHDSGEEWRPEDLVFICCCHPACDGIFRLDRFQKDRSVTLQALVSHSSTAKSSCSVHAWRIVQSAHGHVGMHASRACARMRLYACVYRRAQGRASADALAFCSTERAHMRLRKHAARTDASAKACTWKQATCTLRSVRALFACESQVRPVRSGADPPVATDLYTHACKRMRA